MTNYKEYKEALEFVAPDGGWGWMIVLGAGISNMCMVSILQTFGLIFKDRFEQLEFSPSDTTTLMSINGSFGMILGILNGPLLKKFGYRKVAIFGGILFVSGFFYTAFAESYVEFIVCYGVISSAGVTTSMSGFSLALNTYFKLRRSLASSFAITIMGMGPIILPLLITQLLYSFGWRWTILILVALTMNTFVGAFLLQPVKWHLKREKLEELEPPSSDSLLEKIHKQTPDSHSLFGFGTSYIDPDDILGISESDVSDPKWRSQSSLQKAKLSNYHNWKWVESSCDITRKLRSVTSLDNDDYGDMMKSTLYMLESSTPKEKPVKYASVETLDQISGFNKSVPCESEKLLNAIADVNCNPGDFNGSKMEKEGDCLDKKLTAQKSGIFSKILKFINRLYDIDLLLDPIYVNLLIGLSIATVGEIVFSLLTPFILSEMGLTLEQTALFMSVTAVTDVIFRFLSPFFGHFLKFNSRVMYICSLSLLVATRACLFLATTVTEFLIVSIWLGIGKGFRTVYWSLVVPDYVPLYKLASASAFQSLTSGISLLISGPIIGAIVTGNDNKYTNVVIASNILTLTTIIMWGIEFIIVYHKRRRSQSRTS